jgi:heat shock protein HslJ
MKAIKLFLVILISILFSYCSSGNKVTDPLINDIWILEFIKGVEFNPKAEGVQRPTIEIHLKENKVVGNTGCNNMNGKVDIEEDQITFSDIATTKKFCPESIEQEFLIALGMVNNYKIEKMELHLFQDDDELLIFHKVD